MKLEKSVRLMFVALTIIAMVWLVGAQVAFATDDCRQGHQQCGHDDQGGDNDQLNNEQSQGQGQEQAQGQDQGQDQSQQQTASADNHGNSQSVQFSSPRQVPNMYMNQSGNMIDCARIIGFGGANGKGSFMLGIPAGRQRDCDIWAAVNESQENGHIALSYAFMCEIKNISKVWGKERCNEITAAARIDLDRVLSGNDSRLAELSIMESQHESELDALARRLEEVEERERRDAEIAQRAARRAESAIQRQRQAQEEQRVFAQQALAELEEYKK